MVFVTVGTHEQPFNRLIQKIDQLKKDGIALMSQSIVSGVNLLPIRI